MIQLAFSTVACPDWSLEKIAAQAKSMGYRGVELRTAGHGEAALPCDPALSDPDKIRGLFAAAGVELVCLSTVTSLHHKDEAKGRAAQFRGRQDLELAARLGCRSVRIFAWQAEGGQNQRLVLQRVAERARPLAQRAGELGVQLLFENGEDFCKAREWWWLLDLVDHPMAGLCWNVAAAAAAGEAASVSVPMLHSRIRLAKVADFRPAQPGQPVPLGQGAAGVEAFINRLLGVGYNGFATVEWDRLQRPDPRILTPPEQYLPEASKTLQGWLDAVAKSIEDAKPKPKPARPAPGAAAPGKAAGVVAKAPAAAGKPPAATAKAATTAGTAPPHPPTTAPSEKPAPPAAT